MGRIEKSQGLAPPGIRKDIRAKHARNIINKVVPAILASNARARRGAEESKLVVDPAPTIGDSNDPGKRDVKDAGGEDVAYIKRRGQGRRKVKRAGQDFDFADVQEQASKKSKGKKRVESLDEASSTTSSRQIERKIRIVTTDTLAAARLLQDPNPTKKTPNVCILNMASPLRPGGGVLAGATSQEEFLCARTTLLPSLKESYYRLPELGGIWTSDVLVFRNALPLGDPKGELDSGKRYFVDVISAGMLRFPELEGEEDEPRVLSRIDRSMAERKMRAVLRIAAKQGVKKIVLGAWGCGAYGNPVSDIAKAWRKALDGVTSSNCKKEKSSISGVETWPDLEEVIFAISSRKLAADFGLAFGVTIDVEAGSGDTGEDDEQEGDTVAHELRTKIDEMENQLSKVWNPDLKARVGLILNGLKVQLRKREGTGGLGSYCANSGGERDEATVEEDEVASSFRDQHVTPDSTSAELQSGDGIGSGDDSDVTSLGRSGGVEVST